jgi:hypothetical protein
LAELARFKKGYQSAIVPLRESSRAIGSALRNGSSLTHAQILATFRALSGRWQRQFGQLRSLTPPPNLAGDFDALSGDGTRVQVDLKSIIVATANRSRAAGEHAVADLVTALIAARSADSTIERRLGPT